MLISRDRLQKIVLFLFAAVFVIATSLRLGLAVVNREAFDDHVGVITLMLRNNDLPRTEDCPECFQPKTFYYFAALAIRALDVNIERQDSVILAVQLINFLCGEILLVLCYFFLRDLSHHRDLAGLSAFSLLAFNPGLIAISGMPSNDIFAILFSSAAIYCAWKFICTNDLRFLLLSGIAASIGVATKTNVWCTALAIFLALFLRGVLTKRSGATMLAVWFLAAVSLAVVLNPLSQYLSNFESYGTPVTLNVKKEPFPGLFTKSYVRRPGIVSIQDGLFTFKLLDLLEYPRLTLGMTNYPAHRTSLWTDVYASANSVHFYNSPDSWHTKPDFEVSRSIFILALLPFALLLSGLVSGLILLFGALVKQTADILVKRSFGLFDIVALGYIGFAIALALRYRDFSTMKAVYIYPGLLAFYYLFLEAAGRFSRFLEDKTKWLLILYGLAISFLVVVYDTDVIQMINHLYELNLR